jgi:iron(III) transport system substrate-binding protein
MPRHLSTAAALATVAALSIALAGCAGGGDDAPEQDGTSAGSLDELYEQAVDAGQTTVTIYGPSEAAFAPVYDQFMKAYPDITVATEFLFGGDLRTRIDQEVATGQHVGDLIHLDDSVNYVDNLAPVDLVGVEDAPDDVSLFDGKLYVPSRSLYTFVYNTDKLTADQVPTTWADVAKDDSLKGVTGMSDPTSLAATSTVLYNAYTNDAIDDDWLTAVAALDPQIYQSTSQMVGAVATGEISFTPVAYYGFVVTQKAKGASVGFVIPEDGAVLADNPYGMVDGAPSPLAAQLLVSWLMSPEGQTAITLLANEYGTMPGAPSPSGLPVLEDVNAFPITAPEDRAQFKQDAGDLMKKFF